MLFPATNQRRKEPQIVWLVVLKSSFSHFPQRKTSIEPISDLTQDYPTLATAKKTKMEIMKRQRSKEKQAHSVSENIVNIIIVYVNILAVHEASTQYRLHRITLKRQPCATMSGKNLLLCSKVHQGTISVIRTSSSQVGQLYGHTTFLPLTHRLCAHRCKPIRSLPV